jgi:hypothetical protein
MAQSTVGHVQPFVWWWTELLGLVRSGSGDGNGRNVRTVALVATAAALLSAVGMYQWWSTIRRQLRLFRESALFGSKTDPFRMIRSSNTRGAHDNSTDPIAAVEPWSAPTPNKIRMLDLNPFFVEKHKDKWKLMSLGDYISSLRPMVSSSDGTAAQKLPDWMEREMQAALVAALIKGLGPHLGAAVLPTLAIPWIQSTIHRLAHQYSNDLGNHYNHYLDDDRAAVPLSLSAMTCMAEINYQRVQSTQSIKPHSGTSTRSLTNHGARPPLPTPLDKLCWGEVGYAPTFGTATVPSELTRRPEAESTTPHAEALVPNPFVFSEHWLLAIESMEMLVVQEEEQQWAAAAQSTSRGLQEQQATGGYRHQTSYEPFYDPNSRDLPPPTPIDERWLPDLHLGWGTGGGLDVEGTHTHRQILQNRLLAVVLNRLAFNYARHVDCNEPNGTTTNGQAQPSLFMVQMDSSSGAITRPSDLIQVLMDMGHTVEACVRTHPTTFGIALCVREHERGRNPWTHIPLAYFLQNGYSDEDANEAFACLPHSGLNLEISTGPVLKQGASIQHFMAIDGLCGWHSNHHVANVPWIQTTDCSPIWQNDKMVIDSVCTAGLLAVIINTVGTKYDLPFGGYGLTGVCNDSAALIEYAMSGTTNVYPLTFNGKFAMHNLRVARDLHRGLLNRLDGTAMSRHESLSSDLESLERLIGAIMNLFSDTNTLPSEAADQCRRYLYCHPKDPPFSLMVQSRNVIEEVQRDLDIFPS